MASLLSAPLVTVAQPAPTFPAHAQWTIDTDGQEAQAPYLLFATTGVVVMDDTPYYGVGWAWNTGGPIAQNDLVLQGGIRDDNGRWYYRPVDEANEYLLYDFTGGVGDTVIVHNPRWGMGAAHFIATDVSTVVVEDGPRQQWHLLPMNGGPVEHWIEGIGSTLGLFGHARPTEAAGPAEQLVCFHEDGELKYRVFSGADCALLVGVHDLTPIPPNLHPNPSHSVITLSWSDDNGPWADRLTIRDMAGRIVMAKDLQRSSGPTLIDIQGLASGTYVVALHSEAGSFVPVPLIIRH